MPGLDNGAPGAPAGEVLDDQPPPSAVALGGPLVGSGHEARPRDRPRVVALEDLAALARRALPRRDAEARLPRSVQPDVAGRRTSDLDRLAVALDVEDRGAIRGVDVAGAERRDDGIARTIGRAH